LPLLFPIATMTREDRERLLVYLCWTQTHPSLGDAIIAIFEHAHAIRYGAIYYPEIESLIQGLSGNICRTRLISPEEISAVTHALSSRGVIRNTIPGWFTLTSEWRKKRNIKQLPAKEMAQLWAKEARHAKKIREAARMQEAMRKINEKEKKLQERKSYVYYVSWGLNLGHVKIGYSIEPAGRFKSYLTYNSDTLHVWRIQEVDGALTEKKLHTKFAKYRLTGEWFSHEGKLKEHIQDLSLETALAMQNELDSRILVHHF